MEESNVKPAVMTQEMQIANHIHKIACSLSYDGEKRESDAKHRLFNFVAMLGGPAEPEGVAILQKALHDDAQDAARWRALPACASDHQIDLMALFRDVDAFISTSAELAQGE